MPPTTIHNQLYLWQFDVKAESVEEFERIYGSNGEWERLFRRSFAFRGTALLRDPLRPTRYYTLDFWESDQEYWQFREQMSDDYAELDRKCDALTESERFLGAFTKTPGQI